MARKGAVDYLKCRRRFEEFLNQHKGLLPEERLFIGSPPFTSTAMVFLGPYKVKAMSKAHSYLKVWPIMFGCLNTSLVHIELNKTYGTDALLLSISAYILYSEYGESQCR